MIVYRVAQGKAWSNDTPDIVTTKTPMGAIQLGNLSTFQATTSTVTNFHDRETTTGFGTTGIQVSKDVYTTSDTPFEEGVEYKVHRESGPGAIV